MVLNLISAHEHSWQKSFSVRPLIEAQQSSTEESEPTAQPQEPLEEVTGPRDDHRVRVLFERCLIACALYEEFWTRVNIITNAKNTLNQQWSHFLYVSSTLSTWSHTMSRRRERSSNEPVRSTWRTDPTSACSGPPSRRGTVGQATAPLVQVKLETGNPLLWLYRISSGRTSSFLRSCSVCSFTHNCHLFPIPH